ncbi:MULTISPECIES: acyl-CoA thioesterase [Paenibacillus]|uniref:Acyl-CoA thioester hydrolase n=1 Tax=Paenibacillus lactis TaxID=228574 RepID=A0ABS4F7C8_9BACL|nr:thioesterase family protein [Paenibacillus lactis]MBP1892147.1 acyl-CoA thioester hydrolase [Paenibacillus lactis]MCM3492896.1 acyl-CoA thioesterase [Paenibacillus lactis]HAF98959.1 thioesterase [Paenibacillus lactis]
MTKGSISKLSRWFHTSFRVRYQETDQMGVVYHANYLNWFEIGRTEMIRELGFSYREMEEAGALLPVVDLDVKYHQPARYDDQVTVFTRMIDFSPLRIHYEYEVRRMSGEVPSDPDDATMMALPGELLTSGTTRHVWLNREWKPSRLDKNVPKLYDALKDTLLGRKE